MARVYDGFDERLELPVAVKILRPQMLAIPGMRRRFKQEARIEARLVHPNIVAVLDYGEDRSCSYLIMERLPGTTLRDEIMRGPLPRQRVVCVMAETLAALAAAHKLGVLHRDIKPSNILLDDGHTKITDFGIAKSFDVGGDPGRVADDMTMTGVVLGTPGYLAPERKSWTAGHRAVGPVRRRRGHGRSVDRKVPGSRSRSDRAPSSAVPRRRPSRPDRRSVRSVHLGNRHAAGAGNPTNGATRPPTACDHDDGVDVGRPSGCRSPRRWRDRGVVLAASGAATSRAHPGTPSPGPRRCHRRRGARRRAVPGGGEQQPNQR